MSLSNRFSATNQPRKKKGTGPKQKAVGKDKQFAAAARIFPWGGSEQCF